METTQICSSIRHSILSSFDDELEVSSFQDYCVVTLPIKTVDDRFLDVYVEPKPPDFYIVHDGGKTEAELYTQGLHITDSRMGLLKALAVQFGATFDGGVFTISCRSTSLHKAVLAIGQCASLAVRDILSHSPVVEEEPVKSRVRRTLDSWKPATVDIQPGLEVSGPPSTGPTSAGPSLLRNRPDGFLKLLR